MVVQIKRVEQSDLGQLSYDFLADILAEINQVTFVQKKHPEIFELSGCFIFQSLLQASIPLPVGR